MHNSPSPPPSKMQAAFVASSTLKRNRRYIDIQKLNQFEQQSIRERRRPYSSTSQIHQKINRSFSNSTAAATERLHQDISRFRNRISYSARPQSEDTKRQSYSKESSQSAKNIRGVGIGQHISRQQFYKTKSKPILDERLFNNFSMSQPDEVHTSDMGRGPSRDFDNTLKNLNDISYETQKLYEDVFYKRTTMDCRFKYKKQKEEERYYFKERRKEDKPATELSPKAVKRSESYTQKKQGPIDSFYMNSGRELPCQFDNRTGTPLTSYWRGNKGSIERPKTQYAIRAMKEKLQSQRKQNIKKAKKPVWKSGQICDKKFFIFHPEI